MAFFRLRKMLAAVTVMGLTLGALLSPGPAEASNRTPVDLQILSVSDWHAQLDPMSVNGANVGGAAVLSAYFQADRAENPSTLTLTAGDAFGGSPPLSSLFDEVPAVQAMNLMGFNADALGNHNFDRGVEHLQRMIDVAEFPYLSANLKNVENNLKGVKPFEIFTMNGVKVAVIGVTNPEAGSLVRPGNLGTIEVTDPVPAANKARAEAKKAGAQVFVAITHMGLTGFRDGQPVGPLIDFANNVGGFDVILGDHTDIQYQGIHNNALVVENRSKGLTYAKVNLQVDPANGRMINRTAQFVTPAADKVTPDPAVVAMLKPYRDEMVARFDQRIGVATGLFPRGGNIERLREVAIGNLIADALRTEYGTQVALINGGGIRAALPSSYQPVDKSLRRASTGYAAGPDYDLVVGDVFTVLPFGNIVVTRSVTGEQLYQALEHGVSSLPGANGKFAQVSGLRFTFDSTRPAGSRVVSVTLNDGTPVQRDAATYSLATVDFLNSGGDGYTMLADGAPYVTRELMANVVMEHIKNQGTITPVVDGRIRDIAQ